MWLRYYKIRTVDDLEGASDEEWQSMVSVRGGFDNKMVKKVKGWHRIFMLGAKEGRKRWTAPPGAFAEVSLYGPSEA